MMRDLKFFNYCTLISILLFAFNSYAVLSCKALLNPTKISQIESFEKSWKIAVGLRIKQAIVEKSAAQGSRFSQRDLARAIGMQPARLAKITNGQQSIFIAQAAKAAEVLGAETEWIIARDLLFEFNNQNFQITSEDMPGGMTMIGLREALEAYVWRIGTVEGQLPQNLEDLDTQWKSTVGSRVRKAMIEISQSRAYTYTQQSLLKDMQGQLQQSQLSKIVNGQQGLMFTKAILMSKVLGVELKWLLAEDLLISFDTQRFQVTDSTFDGRTMQPLREAFNGLIWSPDQTRQASPQSDIAVSDIKPEDFCLSSCSTDELAQELRKRGWTVQMGPGQNSQ